MIYMPTASRRQFVKASFAALAAFYAGGWRRPYPAFAAPADVVVAQNGSAADLVRAAVDALGGMSRFVKPGQFVVIKPNFTWGNTPETASDTNPDVLNTVVALCKAAGAGRILVVDHVLIGNLTACLDRTGARKAVESAGGEILGLPVNGQDNRYADLMVAKGQIVKKTQVIKEVLAADVFINVPIAKDHSGARLTMSLKNLMGIVSDRNLFHTGLDQAIADINTQVKSHLVILDAIRILTSNGPSGPGKVENVGKIVAGVDPVAVDSYAAGFFKLTGADLQYIRRAKAAGVGEYDLTKLNVQTVTPGAVPAPQPAASPAVPTGTATVTAAPATATATATISVPGTPTRPASTATPYLVPSSTPTRLAALPTPPLASGGSGLDPAVPLAAVPIVAILAAAGWAIRRRINAGPGGGGAS
jgi:uncharacterized protein (DUF362 family)